jgi:phosphoserine aminotransferase
MLGELIGEFTGKNTISRVLADGKIETSNQGTGKILGMDAFLMSTAIVTVANGTYMGEVNSLITTMDGGAVMMKGNAVSWQSEKGGVTRAASIQTAQSEKLMRLNKVVAVHEYETDEMGNWKGKIWEWK